MPCVLYLLAAAQMTSHHSHRSPVYPAPQMCRFTQWCALCRPPAPWKLPGVPYLPLVSPQPLQQLLPTFCPPVCGPSQSHLPSRDTLFIKSESDLVSVLSKFFHASSSLNIQCQVQTFIFNSKAEMSLACGQEEVSAATPGEGLCEAGSGGESRTHPKSGSAATAVLSKL